MQRTNLMKGLNLKWLGFFLLLFGIIIFQSSCSSKAKASASIQVMARDVMLNTAGNDLTSTNLQSALDNELAIDLTSVLPGTTWTITNITSDPIYSGISGVVSFTTNTFSLSGAFAAFGVADNAYCYIPSPTISYKLISQKVIYESWTSSQGYPQDGTAFVIAQNKDKIILLGTGGCGAVGAWRISVLQRVSNLCTVNSDCSSRQVCQGGICVSTAPNAPTGLSASAGSGYVWLNWSPSSGATSYKIYDSTVSGGPYSMTVGSTSGISMTITGFTTTNTTYYFVVTAINSVGESGYSNEASATPY
ncbi:MAG: fibronectin type III domain-containing protein [Deltaproteobacteria bacterium]|nr:fibronectin type III domain-containing protein [Deltaproteobacteria bacterium]MCL5277294.1 fibronectin type III domain-containing protein [Deltaproteobacteria bacterium]